MSTNTVKPPRAKIPLSIISIAVCTLAFILLLYTERITSLSSRNLFKFKPCAKKNASKSKKYIPGTHRRSQDPIAVGSNFQDSNPPWIPPRSAYAGDRHVNNNTFNYAADDRFEFDPEECSPVHGKWVFNSSNKPLYTDRTCPYIDRQFSCGKNGKNDYDYSYWEWQPDDCILPKFNPEIALRKIQGKRLMFVGDSLQRNQWESFVCMVDTVIPEDQKSMKRGRVHSVFRVKEYNATIEFYWAPFLIESNSDVKIIIDAKKRVLRIDSIEKHAQHWTGVDILVFNTYVWWMSGLRVRSLWGSFANGDEGTEELDTAVSYRIGLKTWANWIDSTIDPNTTRVFFTTMSPTHQRSADWGNENGIKCFNETKPVMMNKKHYYSTGSNKEMMNAVSGVIKKMKVQVTVLNITQLSEYRVDAHSSIYTELQGKLLNATEKEDPLHYADCIHWCLPGVPDTWNRIFFAYL